MKKKLRQTICAKRKNLTAAYQQQAEQQICQQILASECYKKAKTIALYHAQNGEVALNNLWLTATNEGKACYFPIMQPSKTLQFYAADRTTEFIPNRYGILEPQHGSSLALAINQLDIMIAPLVAFDTKGNRLGMGGGYYDGRTLALERPGVFLGVAYEFQRQMAITHEPWDIKLDIVITEKAIYWIAK